MLLQLRTAAFAAVMTIGAASAAPAQSPITQSMPPSRAAFDFTLFDAPYNWQHGLRAPSMQQSLDLAIAGYEGMHGGIEKLFGPRRKLAKVAIGLADFLTTVEVALPLPSVWVHEEFHRVAMGRRGIDSHNDVYDFNIGSDWIAVSHLDDEDLARLKREHPAEWVRVNAAGASGTLPASKKRSASGSSRRHDDTTNTTSGQEQRCRPAVVSLCGAAGIPGGRVGKR